MNIGIIGAGTVGTTLGKRLTQAGHRVVYGVRDPSEPREQTSHDGASAASIRDAVQQSEAVILATPWSAVESVLESAGDFEGKPLLDATNPFGPGLSLVVGHEDSGGEQVQRLATNARVVKAFNTTGANNMGNPAYGDTAATMMLAGDDDDANATAASIVEAVGFSPLLVGGLDMARLLEPLAKLWITLAMKHGREVALQFIHRPE